jgi:hypothetical protein
MSGNDVAMAIAFPIMVAAAFLVRAYFLRRGFRTGHQKKEERAGRPLP